MQKEVIDVNFTELKSKSQKEYYTLNEVAKLLNIEEHNIIFWINKLSDFLQIRSIGMYQIFDMNDINNLKIIKELNIDKKLSIDETKSYLLEHNKAIVIKRENNENELAALNVFAKILNIQNEKMESIVTIQSNMMESQQKFFETFLQSYQEVCIDVTEQKSILNKIQKNQEREIKAQKQQQNNINELKQEINNISETIKTQEQKSSERDTELINRLKKSLDERQLQQEYKQQLQHKKSIFSRLFRL